MATASELERAGTAGRPEGAVPQQRLAADTAGSGASKTPGWNNGRLVARQQLIKARQLLLAGRMTKSYEGA